MPLAVNVGPIQEPEALWARALVTQARMNLAGCPAYKVVFDKGFGRDHRVVARPAGHPRCRAGHNQQGGDGRRPRPSGGWADLTVGRRVYTVRHGQGTTARTERLETEVVGITAWPPMTTMAA